MNAIQASETYTSGRIAMIASRFNAPVVDLLLKGAIDTLDELGVPADHLDVFKVPGAMELPYLAQMLAKTDRYAGILTLGAVIQGETAHFDYVCNEVSRGLMNVSLEHHLPVIFGVLTTNTSEQALERADPNKRNKGGYCAKALVEMINLSYEVE